MANFFVRASNDLPVSGGNLAAQPQKLPFPGHRYDVVDAEAAAAAHMAAFPALRAVPNLKLLVYPESAIVPFDVAVQLALGTLPTYV